MSGGLLPQMGDAQCYGEGNPWMDVCTYFIQGSIPGIQVSQIKGKESENSYQELKRSQKGQAHTNTRL